MSDANDEQTTPQSGAKPKPPAGNPAVKWTVRCLVYGALILLLGLAGYDFYVKKQHAQTISALEAKESAINKGELDRKEFEQSVLVGDPEIADGKNTALTERKIYKWNGVFRTYRLQVEFQKPSGTLADWETL